MKHKTPILLSGFFLSLILLLLLALKGTQIPNGREKSDHRNYRGDNNESREASNLDAGSIRTPSRFGKSQNSNSTLPATDQFDSIADLLEGVDLSDPDQRKHVVDAAAVIEKRKKSAGVEAAKKAGLPERIEHPDGRVQEICGVDPQGRPIYFTTHNANANITSGASILRNSPYLLRGVPSLTVGVWDGGSVRGTHQEFGDRVSVRDGSATLDHSTHVAGTIGSEGWSLNSRGAAPEIPIASYDWNGDRSEMIGAAAATAHEAIGNSGKLLVSNHSYGYVSGWNYVGGGSPFRAWEWWGDSAGADGVESDFGMYNTFARDTDSLAVAAPYYLMVRSAGNDRNNNPSTGSSVALSPGSDVVVAYDPSLHPSGDGTYKSGYDTLSYDAVAKNILSVGSVSDSVTGGVRDVNKANISSFSVYGPTDDGRIKPDLVANGESLYSTTAASDASYGTSSGTSMAAPGVTGIAMLLAEQHVMERGSAMRASTLKGLLIHTADDRGNVGPDYRFGWGLVNGKSAADLLIDDHANPGKMRMSEAVMTSGGATMSFPFLWDGSSPIKATICWTDPAGTVSTVHDSRISRLRHNLDIKVISPSGTIFFPYVMPFVGTWTQANVTAPAVTGTNNTDNVEQVYISAPAEEGEWVVQVSRQGTLTSAQPYSLFVSGSTSVQEAAVSISNLTHVYDGAAKTVSVATDPPGLPFIVTYNGGAQPPTQSGAYAVSAVVDDPLFQGSSTAVMEIFKASQSIDFPVIGDMNFGEAGFFAGATSSAGLPIEYSSSDTGVATVSEGGFVEIVGSGSVSITATQGGGVNHTPAEDVSRSFTVFKADALIEFSALSAIYDGTPKRAVVNTVPPGLAFSLLYNETPDEPVNPGSYSLTAEVTDPNYQGEGAAIFRIQDTAGGITFDDWKIANFGELAIDGNADADGDGVPNVAEFYLQLDPHDPSSRLSAGVVNKTGGGLQLRLSPVVSQGSYTLREWTNLTGAPGDQPFLPTESEISSGSAERDLPAGSGNRFFQIIYTPPFANP